MRVRRGVDDDAAAGERLHLVADACEQLAMRFDRIELDGREVERERQEQTLRRRAVTRELAHHVLVQHALVGGMLVDDCYPGIGLKKDIRVEHLEQRGHLLSAVSRLLLASEQLQWPSNATEG